MTDLKLSAAEGILSAFLDSPNLASGWVVDDRFSNVVMRVFSKDEIKTAWPVLETIFAEGFEEESLPQASKEVRHLASEMGGLRNDQFLFVKEDTSGLVAFTAIWPWQNAPQASIRLGFAGIDRLDPVLFERLLIEP